jgi:RNA 3'-terminal phosphate cyclase (ATP)
MLVIDGSFGEGGGQILRSALALSLVTGEPFRMENIRANRKKPGLLNQHLTAVQAAASIGQAKLEGASLGSKMLTFRPGRVTPGEYFFSIGTAGSATLVLQAVLPALLGASGPSQLTLSGGTHNPMAPPFDYLQRVFVPLVSALGPRVSLELHRHGFFPAGGGKFTVRIEPAAQWRRLDLHRGGERPRISATALVAKLPRHIAERELSVVATKMSLPEDRLEIEEISDSLSPGNVLMIEMASREVTELVTAFGQRGVRAEDVAASAVREANEFLSAAVPVGPHLADQLLIPLALAGGGSYDTLALTLHTTTNVEVVRKFLDIQIHASNLDDGIVRVEVVRDRRSS